LVIYPPSSSSSSEGGWISQLPGKLVTDTPVQRIFQMGNRMLQYYTSQQRADQMMQLSESERQGKVHQDVANIFQNVNNQEIKKPLWSYNYYWKAGIHMWKPGIDVEKVSSYLAQPNPELPFYLANESYTIEQRWMESSLASAEKVLQLISKFGIKKMDIGQIVTPIGMRSVGGSSNSSGKKRGNITKKKKNNVVGEMKYSLEEVSRHNKVNDAWMIIKDKVYRIPSTWINRDHPGGLVIMQGVGKDATNLFNSIGHSSYAMEKLKTFQIGVLKK